jgi:PhzF family phenazine biosynthesis protein
MQRRFSQVDAFTTDAYFGNPCAVVLDGDGLNTERMQLFARWTNLSETTFLLPPTEPAADYRVRIFTPVAELPFAGHPTLASCHAWLEGGGSPKRGDEIVQECEAGLVRLRRSPGEIAFAAPPLLRSGPVEEDVNERVAAVLGIERSAIVDTQWVDNGPGWVAALLEDAEAVLAVRPNYDDLDVGLVGPHPTGHETAFEVRAFFPKDGVMVEDPVTGSLNASLAEWLLRTGRAQAPYIASQGGVLRRNGRVRIVQDDDGTIWVGGGTITCIWGSVEL